MRTGIGLLLGVVAVVAIVALCGCGGSDRRSPTATRPDGSGAPASANTVSSASNDSNGAEAAVAASSAIQARVAREGFFKDDGDKDNDDDPHSSDPTEHDDTGILETYGSEANAREAQAVTELVRAYYAAAAAEDGAGGCSMLAPALAAGLAEQHGTGEGRGKGCVAALHALFTAQHKQLLADEVRTMGVVAVRVNGNAGVAVLAFKHAPEGEVLLERVGSTWKLDALLDSGMP